jgi:hypothetical protein
MEGWNVGRKGELNLTEIAENAEKDFRSLFEENQ